jgi:spoIIIJ-associated protein
MQWVETTGKTVDEAVDLALDQLGVARDDAEIDVLEEPKTGLFGRVRAEARIRARVRPVKPRAKEERRDRKPKGAKEATAPKADTAISASAVTTTEKAKPRRSTSKAAAAVVAEIAAEAPKRTGNGPTKRSTPSVVHTEVPKDVEEIGVDFLEGLIDAFGLDATITTGIVGDGLVEFRLNGSDLGVLIGPKAQTLLAIQDLLRSVIHYGIDRDGGRIVLDIAGYRERRRAALEAFTRQVADEVLATGEVRSLEPMSPADRKVVHDTVNDLKGIRSESEGEEPNRKVVLLPA